MQVLGVSFDTIQENAAFAKKFNFPFPLLCDTDRTVGIAYGTCQSVTDSSAKRITYVIDPKGKIKQAFGKVQVANHPEELLTMM